MKTTKYYYIIVLLIGLISFILPLAGVAQLIPRRAGNDVRGRVVDADSYKPLGGAIISVNNGTITSSTDWDGYFLLHEIESGNVLHISHVGFSADSIVISGAQEPLFIGLKKVGTILEEVVVSTGYQKISKEKLVGSVSVIDQYQLSQQTGINILQRLNHVASGLLFNNGKFDTKGNVNEFSIRGLSTINGPVRPLIVLDNFIYEGSISDINPYDVESVTVLKDAAAASLWGARAGNGVVVITTKKGDYGQKTKLFLNSTITATSKPDLFYRGSIQSSDFIGIERGLFERGFFNNAIRNTKSWPALSPAVELFQARKQAKITEEELTHQLDLLAQNDIRRTMDEYFYKRGLSQQYNVQASGGAENIAWIFSGSFVSKKGSLMNEDSKANLRLSNTYKLLKGLSAKTDFYYTRTSSRNGLNSSFPINGRSIPYLPLVNSKGESISVDRYRRAFTDTAGQGMLLDWGYYPLEDYKHDRFTTNQSSLLAGIELRYRLANWLNINFNYQHQQFNTSQDRLSDEQSFYTRDLINTFSRVDYVGRKVQYIVPRGSIRGFNGSTGNTQNFRTQLDFEKQFNQHDIATIAGAEVRQAITKERTSQQFYGYEEDPLKYSNVDLKTYYPSFISGYWQQVPGAPTISPATNNRFLSFYGNASYSYKRRYLFYASFRKDASNTFGLGTNDKWNPLWSGGLKWDLYKENFYKSRWLKKLSSRISMGTSGNVDVNKTPLPISGSGLYDFITGYSVMVINNPNNPLLRWEKVTQMNLGIDFTIGAAALSGSVDYYRKKGSDLYGNTSFDYTTFPKTGTVNKNVAEMKGNGLEMLLNAVIIDRLLNWQTRFIFNYSQARTTRYLDKSITAESLLAGGGIITPVVGYPLYSIAAYRWGGLDSKGDPQGYLDGHLSKDYKAIGSATVNKGFENGEMKYLGSTTPVIYGALINYWHWRGLSASVNISYNLGYFIRKAPFTSDALVNRGTAVGDFYGRWQHPGDEMYTDIPAFVFPDYTDFYGRDRFYRNSEVNVLRGDHVRLEYINLGYLFEKLFRHIKGVQLNLNASNLGILWRANKEHLDPEYHSTIPLPASYSVGININL